MVAGSIAHLSFGMKALQLRFHMPTLLLSQALRFGTDVAVLVTNYERAKAGDDGDWFWLFVIETVWLLGLFLIRFLTKFAAASEEQPESSRGRKRVVLRRSLTAMWAGLSAKPATKRNRGQSDVTVCGDSAASISPESQRGFGRLIQGRAPSDAGHHDRHASLSSMAVGDAERRPGSSAPFAVDAPHLRPDPC